MDTCVICGAVGAFERLRLREMLFGSREAFTYLLCPECGTLRIGSVPDDLARHYPPGYNASLVAEESPELATGLRRRADVARNRNALFRTGYPVARLLRRWTPPRSRALAIVTPIVQGAELRSFDDPVLDVGCGRVAVNLDRLRIVGFRRLVGVDPFLDEDTDYRGIPLRRAAIHEVEGRFRLIMFNHSFEHIPDPHQTLEAARSRLAVGGCILLRMPVMGTALWRTYGTDWWELEAPRHLFLYTTRGVDLLARAHGLRVTRTIWEGTGVGIATSEQVRRDIAFLDERSYVVNRPGIFDESQLHQFDVRARELNAMEDGSRAAFFLRADE